MNFKKLLSLFLFLLPFFINAQKFHVGTYNLRNDNKDDSLKGNGWGQRFPIIAQLIRFHDFDIFGTQEGKFNQLNDLKDSLPGYTFIGIGRDDGKQAGEFSAIFYKEEVFTLLDKGDFWLSETTDKPNKGWDAVLPRICSWGRFKEKRTGFTFYFFNLHMDHIGVKARAESSKLILEKIREWTPGKPVILTGDFNVDQTNESYTLINTSGILRDAYELSPLKYALNGTFNNFRADNKTNSRIDHIFVTKDFNVTRYGILTDTYRTAKADTSSAASSNFPREMRLSRYTARTPSDHFPVMIEVQVRR
jgi:endonuclease/exonuclease/phosphatase family metal-dependent hydrolase